MKGTLFDHVTSCLVVHDQRRAKVAASRGWPCPSLIARDQAWYHKIKQRSSRCESRDSYFLSRVVACATLFVCCWMARICGLINHHRVFRPNAKKPMVFLHRLPERIVDVPPHLLFKAAPSPENILVIIGSTSSSSSCFKSCWKYENWHQFPHFWVLKVIDIARAHKIDVNFHTFQQLSKRMWRIWLVRLRTRPTLYNVGLIESRGSIRRGRLKMVYGKEIKKLGLWVRVPNVPERQQIVFLLVFNSFRANNSRKFSVRKGCAQPENAGLICWLEQPLCLLP